MTRLLERECNSMSQLHSRVWRTGLIELRGNPAFDTLQPWQQKTTEKNNFENYRQVRKRIEKKLKIRAVGRTRRRGGPWPTWARTWTATSLGPPPPHLSTPSPRSCPPSNFQLWTQLSLLEGEQEIHKRMRNLFWGCRWAIVLVQQSKDNPMYQNCWNVAFSIPRSRMEQEVAQLQKVGWPRKLMNGCRVWPRSSGLSGSWPAWSWAWSALVLQYPFFPCFWSIQENSPCYFPWAAPSPCPASPSCGVPTTTWCTCWAERDCLSPPSISPPSSSPSTSPWASSPPSLLQSQHVLK